MYREEMKMAVIVIIYALFIGAELIATAVGAGNDWTNGFESFDLDDADYRAFVVNDSLVPFAVATELN